MFYTAVSKQASSGDWIARLSLASANDPTDYLDWVRHGPLFPDVNGFQFTKSGALLLNDHLLTPSPTTGTSSFSTPPTFEHPSYLIFGDCSLYNGLQVAQASNDFLNYTVLEDFLLIQPRERMFDSKLVESGPPPLRLNDGNWFFIYNAAQHLYGTPNNLFYNPGWAILNGTDPLQVMYRASTPMMMPTYLWELKGLTPYVIFVEGMRRAPPDLLKQQQGLPPNSTQTTHFVVYYGAADTNVGVALITVASQSAGGYRVTTTEI